MGSIIVVLTIVLRLLFETISEVHVKGPAPSSRNDITVRYLL